MGSGEEVVSKPEERSVEARWAESRGWVLGEAQPAPSHQLVSLGSVALSEAEPQPKLNLVSF